MFSWSMTHYYKMILFIPTDTFSLKSNLSDIIIATSAFYVSVNISFFNCLTFKLISYVKSFFN